MRKTDLPTTRGSLIHLLQQGDLATDEARQNAWREFVDMYGPTLLRWARRWCWHQVDAEDVVQRILISVFNGVDTFVHGQSRFRCWLKTVARNEFLRWLEKKKHLPSSIEAEKLEQMRGPALEDLEQGLDDATSNKYELAKRVEAEIRRRSPSAWEAYRQRVVEDRRAADVAADMGISIGYVHTLVTRVRMEYIPAALERLGLKNRVRAGGGSYE